MDELISKLNSYPNSFAFRGQANSDWPLISSLERIVPDSKKRRKVEEFTLKEFIKKFPLYSGDIDKPENKLSWLSLMQHYGIPTRLLDFTTSPYVALYFAIENLIPNDSGSISIYAIDYDQLVRKSCEYVKESTDLIDKYSENFAEKCEEAFENILERSSYDVLWFVDPMQLNDRIEKQSGTFLISGSFNKNIDELIRSIVYKEVVIEEIIIPQRYLESIYSLLRKMNLGPKNIYGNIEGLAKHLQLQAKIYAN